MFRGQREDRDKISGDNHEYKRKLLREEGIEH
jgi:hypothetical protein